ncbi:hypothetical protein BC629DRAFT_1464151 [Irpex lacteus]|nr:hypothetical protein BC629DRAFT_1464151 [Irpex lacteus]
MTPARSRLTGDNLLRIAELHAHLKETHKKSGLSTQRLRRELNPSSQTLDSLMPQLPQAATLSSDNAGSDSASQLTPSLAALSLTSLSSSPTVVDEREEIQIDSDTSGDSDKEADDDECEADSDRGNDVRTLADIARSLIELADESERIVADLAPRTTTHSHRTFESGSTGLPDRPFRFDITEIFNFRETYWFDAIEQQAESGLASETDLCEYFESNGTDTMTDM